MIELTRNTIREGGKEDEDDDDDARKGNLTSEIKIYFHKTIVRIRNRYLEIIRNRYYRTEDDYSNSNHSITNLD